MSFEISKIYTDNPYVDELVYYTKLLGIGTVLKMQDQADAAETVSSLKNAELYLSCLEGTAIMEVFPNDALVMREALNKVGMTSGGDFGSYVANKQNFIDDYRKGRISKEDYEKVTQYHRDYYINNYEEENNYYRMLHGLPNFPVKTPTEFDDYVEDDLAMLIPEDVFDNAFITFQLESSFGGVTKHLGPIHRMNDSEIAILNQYGVIEEMIKLKPTTRQYMKYLGDKKIDYYLARKAYRFDPLYIPTIESDEVYRMYKDKLDSNKFYVLRTVYSEAFKYGSDYYDNFIAALIVIITMVDIISRVHEFIARKEIFDIRSVEYIFESYGVPFFEEIPLKYQTAMVKNIHTLLKYKSTSKCMIDICSLFGFENIQIFKYYLLRDRKTNPDGSYFYSTNEDGDLTHDPTEEYELRFIKVPLEDDFDQYSQVSTNYLDYDEVVNQDSKWNGGADHNELVKSILKEEFNVVKTKYMSIDTVYDVTKMSVQQSYFFNMLYDSLKYETSIKLQVPFIDTAKEFEAADLFTLLTVLTYLTNNIEDIIMDTSSKILYVNGFNFKADLATLASEIANKENYGTNELSSFQKPVSSIPSFSKMMDMYVNNMSVRDTLIEGMKNADNLTIYKIYKALYDSLMTVRYTTNYFKINPVEVDAASGKLITSPDRIINPVEDPDRLITDASIISSIRNGSYAGSDYWESNGNYYYYYFEDTDNGRVYYDYYRNEKGVYCDYYRETIDGERVPTYKAYLEAKEFAIYGVIAQALSYTDENSKNQYIATVIDSVVYAMEEYIDSDQFQALFANLPAMGSESVKRYISLVIDFYKSYKVDFLGLNTIYTMDDKHEGLIKIIDDMRINAIFDRPEFINIWEKFGNAIVGTTKDEKLKLLEKLYFDIFTFVYFDGQVGDNHRDMLVDDTRVIKRGKNIGTTIVSEKIHDINIFFEKEEVIKLLTDKFANLLVSVNPKLRVELVEALVKVLITKRPEENVDLIERFARILVSKYSEENIALLDRFTNVLISVNPDIKVKLIENLSNVLIYKNPEEDINLNESFDDMHVDMSKDENIELLSSQLAKFLITITPIERVYLMENIAEIIISKAPEEKIGFFEKLYFDISTFVYFDGLPGDNHRDALSESVQLLEDLVQIYLCIEKDDNILHIKDVFATRITRTAYKSGLKITDSVYMSNDDIYEEKVKIAEMIASIGINIQLKTIINSSIVAANDKKDLYDIMNDYIFAIVSSDHRNDAIHLIDCLAVNASSKKSDNIGIYDKLWIYNSIA